MAPTLVEVTRTEPSSGADKGPQSIAVWTRGRMKDKEWKEVEQDKDLCAWKDQNEVRQGRKKYIMETYEYKEVVSQTMIHLPGTLF